MRIGISIAQCDRLARPAAVVAAVKAAEQLGYSSVWVCDSALDPAGVLSAAAASSWVSVRTPGPSPARWQLSIASVRAT